MSDDLGLPPMPPAGPLLIGSTFADELAAAGLAGIAVAWSPDGSVTFGEGVTPGQRAAFAAVRAAHDPATVDLAAYARDLAWRKRTGGTLIGGVRIPTDDASLTLIAGMRDLALIASDRIFRFDAGLPEALPLTADQASSLAVAVATFVQGTFDARATVLAGIKARTITTTAQIDAAFADL